jgi:hypothetical protein
MAICGWAIPEMWFSDLIEKTFPDYEITVHYPENPADKEEAKNILHETPCDLYIGYSLGSLWLLYHKEYLSIDAKKVLLAPIINFTNKDCGSKISHGQLNVLIKQIKNKPDPISYVQEFFNFSEINIPETDLTHIPNRSTLSRGLEYLLNQTVPKTSLAGFMGVIGASDKLLDCEKIHSIMPQLKIVPNTGHDPKLLLEAIPKLKLHPRT